VVLIRVSGEGVILDRDRMRREQDFDVLGQIKICVFIDELRNSVSSPFDERIDESGVIKEVARSIDLHVIPKLQCLERIGEVFTVLTVRRIRRISRSDECKDLRWTTFDLIFVMCLRKSFGEVRVPVAVSEVYR